MQCAKLKSLGHGVGLGLGVVLVSSCSYPTTYDFKVWRWCARAIGASGVTPDGDLEYVIANGSDGSPAWGCRNLCPVERNIMDRGEEGEFSPEHPLYDDWQGLRQDILERAISSCEWNFQNQDLSPGEGTLSCEDAVLGDEENPFFYAQVLVSNELDPYCQTVPVPTSGGLDEGTGGVDGGTGEVDGRTGDGGGEVGPDVFDLDSYEAAFPCTGGGNRFCSVREDFSELLRFEPVYFVERLTEQGVMLAPGSSGKFQGFQFANVPVDSLLAYLGVEGYDVLVSLNGFRLDTPDQITAGWVDALDSNLAEFRLSRSGRAVTIRLELAPPSLVGAEDDDGGDGSTG